MRAITCVGLLALAACARLPGAEIAQPEFDGDSVTVEFGEPATQITSGGSGRYFVALLPEAKKLALFDVSAAKITKTIPLPAADIRFAAGEDKLLVAAPGQRALHRYTLDTLAREKTVPLPGNADIKRALMGSSSAGPLLLWSDEEVTLWDIEAMKPLKANGDLLRGSDKYGFDPRVSADGQSFTGWVTGISSQKYSLMRVHANRTTVVESPDAFSESMRFAQPSADGSRVWRNGPGLYDRAMQPLPCDALKGWGIVPCEDPAFFLAVREQPIDKQARPKPPTSKQTQLAVGLVSDLQLLATVSDIEPIMSQQWAAFDWQYFKTEPRVHWLPTAKTLVVLPYTNDRVMLRRFDFREQLAAQQPDGYLIVVSKPNEQMLAAAEFVYSIKAWSNDEQLTFKLESGPKGMTVNEAGEVRWSTKKLPAVKTASVIVVVNNSSGQEVMHSFQLKVSLPTKEDILASKAKKPAPAKAPAKNAAPAEEPEVEGGGEVTLVAPRRLELPSSKALIVPGLDGRLLVVGNDGLTVLAADGLAIEKKRKLPKAYSHLIERDKYFVGLAREPRSIDVIDKSSGAINKSLDLSATELLDLAPHPTLPLSYVSVRNLGDLPRAKFVVFNETSGEADEKADLVGGWLAVSPDGKTLVAGYADIYERGSQLIFNPDRIHVVPDYGNLDWLIRYRLDRKGTPSLDAIKQQVGGNGKGLRMSPDGKRVSYLSVVGSPPFSKNLSGWQVADFAKLPIVYRTKDRATTLDLAFHPWLPLVATLGEEGPVFFHRETGVLDDDRLKSGADNYGDKLVRVYFSPDGKNLLVRSSLRGLHNLIQVPLKLKEGEPKRAPAPKPKKNKAPESKPDKATIET